MPDSVALVAAVLAFGLTTVAIAWLGGGSHLALRGLFPVQGTDDWPRGVQEGDAPQFALEHVDALRADPLGAVVEGQRGPDAAFVGDPADPRPEVVELYTRRLGARRLVPLAPHP